MDHKKLKIESADKERLKALLKQSEAAVDDLSDADLAQAEATLEARMKALVPPGSGTQIDPKMEAGWNEIEKRLRSPDVHGAEVVSLGEARAKRKLAWAPLGALAAAAVALLVLYPRTQTPVPGDPSQMQIKGGESVFTQNCELDFRGQGPDELGASADGTAFDGKIGSRFEITFICDSDGYVQVWTKTPPAMEFRNIPVRAQQRQGLTEGEQLALFPLVAGTQTFEFALTPDPIDASVDLMDITAPAMELEGHKTLWSDSVMVKGSDQ